MATLTTFTNRLLLAGGFAVAVAAMPAVVALSTPAPTGPALAECPSTEIADPVTGACQPISDVAPPTQNPINPEGAALAPGAITEGSGSGSVGQVPEVNGIPCTGGNTGQCIGLQEATGGNNAAGVELPPVPVGVQP